MSFSAKILDEAIVAPFVVGLVQIHLQPIECEPKPPPATSRHCIELIALSRRYEPFNTCLANRRSTVSRPSRNFAWVACNVRHAASFRPTDFSAIARLVAALRAHDKLACLSDSSRAARKYCPPTATPSWLTTASSPLIRRSSGAYHWISSRSIFARSKTASPCRARPATAVHLANSACSIPLKTR